METTHLADSLVRDTVARVDRRRRANATNRRVWRAAPWVAGGAAVVAAAARTFGLPAVLPLSVLAAGAAGLGVAAVLGRRARDISDRDAARIDADAALGGELRSAHWFAGQAARDDWAALHLDRAAARIQAVGWDALYPSVDARRALAVSMLLVVATLALTWNSSARRTAAAAVAARTTAAGSGPTLIALPEDLRKRLEELLSKIERGGVSAEEARAQVAELRDLMSKIDPNLEASLADLAKRAAQGVTADRGKAGDETKALADRTEQTAENAEGLPQDVRFSLENLAAKLANQAKPSDGKPGEKSAGQNAEQQQGSTGGSTLSDAMKGGLMVRESAADPGGEMTMAGAGAASGDSRPGAGGNRGAGGTGQLLDIEKALRKETVEASTDTTGQNVIAEVRRKTEQGQAKVGFTHAAAPAAFAPSHAVPPPSIPEDRRALLLNYFIRRQ